MTCKKKTFETKEQAIKRADEIRYSEGFNKPTMRSYKCPVCSKFHLTTQTNQKHINIKNAIKDNKESINYARNGINIEKIGRFKVRKFKGWKINLSKRLRNNY